MELKIGKSPLLVGLQRAQNIVEKKTTLPILSHILLDARAGALELSSTDLEVGVIESCEASVLQDGSTTVHARKLFEIIRELPEEQIHLGLKQGQLEIRCGRSRFRLRCLPPEEFPQVPPVKSSRSIHLPGALVRDMIRRIIHSVSGDESRYTLTGALLQMERKEEKTLFRMITTDGHRLSLCERVLENTECIEELTKGSELDPRHVILPRKGILEMGRLVEEDGQDIEFGVYQENAFLRRDKFFMMMRLIQGKFPDYRSVIPGQIERSFSVEASALEQSLRRVSVLSTEKARGVRLAVESGKMTIFSNSPEIGEAQEEVDIQYSGESFEAAFNFRYLLDILEIATGTISLDFGKGLKPCLIREETDPQFLYVVMPLRL
ncbi:MAG: DNA polymerase III subunit beta [bacterium]